MIRRRLFMGLMAAAVVICALPLAAQNAKARIVIVATGGTIAGSAESTTAAGYKSGAVAVDVRISEWLLLCTFLLALFLALGKRRAELALEGVRARPVLSGYAPALVDQLLAIVAAATIAAYAAYALTAHDSGWLVVTVPFVVYGLFRYLLLLHRRGVGEEPDALLVEDVPLLVTVAAWAATCAVILGLG